MKFFIVLQRYPDHTEAECFTRAELEEKSWTPPCDGINPLLTLDCGGLMMEIHGFDTLREARQIAKEVRTS